MISKTAALSSPCASSSPVHAAGDAFSWHHIADVFSTQVWDEENRAKDRQDETRDAMRVSNGMTLDQFLESAR